MNRSTCTDDCRRNTSAQEESIEQTYAWALATLVGIYVIGILVFIVAGIVFFGYAQYVVWISAAIGFVPMQWFMNPFFKTLFAHRPK